MIFYIAIAVFWCSITLVTSQKCTSIANGSNYSDISRRNSSEMKFAIVALVSTNRISDGWLTKRNELLARYLRRNASSSTDLSMLFFSESKFDISTIEEWKQTFSGTVAKVELVDTANKGFNNGHGGFAYGYEYMCKFFMLDIYEYLVERKIDYYIRMDSDCFIVRLDYDIFSWILSNKVQYGYGIISPENHGKTVDTMPNW
jgi:hypothetical protein